MQNSRFEAHLARMAQVHDSKNHDYADDQNPYSNFEAAAQTAGCSVDTVFRVLIGVKLARLHELQKGEKAPRHESVDDSLLDLSVYAALWASYHAPNLTMRYRV